MRLLTGRRLGPYRVDGLIGRGASGEVYRAHDLRVHRDVALRVFWHGRPALSEFFALIREGRIRPLLDHPNIATVYDVGTHDGMPFIVSELLQGRTLRARLTEGALSQAVAASFGRQIADGLAAAHALGVVHGDLRPENIFVTVPNRVKIIDFGLAKCLDEALELLQHGGSNPARMGTMCACVGYMSPEQVRGDVAGQRSDIFSLGVLLFEMVSGATPFRGNSIVATLNAILEEEPPAPGPGNARISAALERVIRRCLEKNPAARFESARDLRDHLESALGSTDLGMEARDMPWFAGPPGQDVQSPWSFRS